MDTKKLPPLKKIENAKVRVSKNGKWLTHIFPEQGLMTTFSMNYYRSILKSYPETILTDSSEISEEQKIMARLEAIMIEVNSFNTWLSKCSFDCQPLVLGQISLENASFANKELSSDMLAFVTETLNQSIDHKRNISEKK